MQTFLPYPDMVRSAQVLDNRRLGNQRNETTIILRACLDPTAPWAKHAATRLWRGYEPILVRYGRAIVAEWVSRGFRNTVSYPDVTTSEPCLPPWWGNEEFHASHRAALLMKKPEWYSQFGWTETPGPAIWPS